MSEQTRHVTDVCDRCGEFTDVGRVVVQVLVPAARSYAHQSTLCGDCSGKLRVWLEDKPPERRERPQNANLRPWRPGQSGNPAGRPPKPRDIFADIFGASLKPA